MRKVILFVVLATCAALTLPQVASAAVPKCFGKKATIVGTNKADVLKGTPKADVIVALGGNDTVRGLGGRDFICGGGGNDKLYGGGGSDLLYGDKGNDLLLSQGGMDDLIGAAGDDTLDGTGSAFVWADYYLAPNGVEVNLSTGQATGEGTDKLIHISGLFGSAYDDTLTGDAQQNVFAPLAGNDTIDGGGGPADAVVYWYSNGPVTVDLSAGTATGEGTDTIAGIEWVDGSDYGDTITGDANPNRIWGNGGNDTIAALDGDDAVFGGDGDDTIDAGAGSDVVDGGSGTDACRNGEDVTGCES